MSESLIDSFDEVLDGGLRVAFGAAQPGGGQSILASLEETLGIHPRVLLRDAEADPSPVALPARADQIDLGSGLGRYQLAGELARGGVGVVLKGRDPDLGRDVAIKILRAEHMSRPGMAERFIEEAQIAAQLQHPGILPVYELGIADGHRPYFSMKLIKGRTLAALLGERTTPAQDRERFLGIFEQVCQATAYAHARAVVHRDLKPSNVMVGAFGEVQVVDWGLAKVLSSGGLADERDDDASIIETVRTADAAANSIVGSVIGTPAYMSQEQANGEVHRLNERSDVFSLGAILCEILTGAPPFTGERREAVAKAQSADLGDALERLDACDADQELVDLTRQCLSPSTTDRPRHAGNVAERITLYLASLGERARASELAAARADAVAKSERRARRLTIALASVTLVTVLAFFAALVWSQQQRHAQQVARDVRVNEAIDVATQLLGRAAAAPIGDKEPWLDVGAAARTVVDRLHGGHVSPETQHRAESLLSKLATAERDRRLVENVEEVVIMGATHFDADSWTWMEDALRKAFLAYDIDLRTLTPDETAQRIRQSDLSTQLTDALELWIATRVGLGTFGVANYPISEGLRWMGAVYAADPDPFATKVRKLVYSEQPTIEQVRELMDSVNFADVRPRTLSWLASAAYRAGDFGLVEEIFRRALLQFPGDLMLNFDQGFNMVAAGKFEKAIRAYERCLALRPHSAGLWRSLGTALVGAGDLNAAVDAIRQSAEHQPDHPPTYVDLGTTLEKLEDRDGAVSAFERALELNPKLTVARESLDRLRAAGQIEQKE